MNQYNNEVFGIDVVDAAINELKSTSKAYKNWQRALRLRESLYKRGFQNTEYGLQINSVIKALHEKWVVEMDELKNGIRIEVPSELVREFDDLYDIANGLDYEV